jgi:hypothetical protein
MNRYTDETGSLNRTEAWQHEGVPGVMVIEFGFILIKELLSK